VVCQLLHHKTDTNICDENGNNALHWAAFTATGDIVKYLLYSSMGIENANLEKQTPVLAAASTHNWDVVEMLIERNSNTGLSNKCGSTLLHYLAGMGNIDLINNLLNRNTESDKSTEEQGATILYLDTHNT
jgi:ankyrin repeat protein